jgi:hypothetical protein
MSWAPNDLVTDQDLKAYESTILSAFGVLDWTDKRVKALEDWIFPILRARGFTPERLRTRVEADQVWGFTGSVYTNVTTAAKDPTADDLDLAAIFTTVGTDALYLGSTQPFRGLSVRMLEAVSAVSATVTVSYWGDGWTTLVVTDGTQKTAQKSFSGGGAITWRVPSDWVPRGINAETTRYYYVKITISATPTSAKASQVGLIRRSCLCAPATLRTLALIMREAPSKSVGPWLEKAVWYENQASDALERALQIVGGEFETDIPPTDLISPTEAAQTNEEAGGGPFVMERA